MTDPSGIIPTAPGSNASGGSKGQIVQIVSLPDALKNNARAIRLEGEVVQQNNDGSTRIRTPQGDIDITMRGRQPQPGQKVEVDIPPGSPPRNVTVRPAPAQPAPQEAPLPAQPPVTTRPALPPTQAQPPPTGGTTQPLPQTQPATRQPVTTQPLPAPEKPQVPLPGSYQLTAQSTPAPATAQPIQQLPPLVPGQIVKLVPMPTGAIPLPTPDAPEVSIIAKTEMQTALIPQKSQNILITTLLQAVKSALPESITPQAVSNFLTANAKQAVPSATPATVSAKPMLSAFTASIPTLTAKIVSMILPSGQTLTAPPATTATATPAPIVVSTPSPVATPTLIATPAAPITHVNSAPLLTVTITEVTKQNQPIVPIPMNNAGAVQNFVLQSPPASVPVGTQVTLQPQLISSPVTVTADHAAMAPMPTSTITAPASALPPAWRSLLPLMQPASLWPVMDEMFQTFYQATPQAAQILGRTIPSPANGAHFGPAVMLFAAALKSGELQTWLGEKKLEMIQKLGKDSLLSRLSGETSSLSGGNDAPATEWKSFPIPLLWQNEISKILFHVRKEPSENEQENAEGGTRFVMDLSLTRMGDVQLDGLVRGKRLDLVVRTELPVSSLMQEAMATAYASALDGTDIYGEIGFQSDRTNWENVLQREDAMNSLSL
jgi:hypothetical protein